MRSIHSIRLFTVAIIAFFLASDLHAIDGRLSGWCELGGQSVTITGLPVSTTKVQRSYPACTVTVYEADSITLATIYSDTSSTPLPNPFTASSNGYWYFYAADGYYDVRISGGGMSAPFTYGHLNINTSTGGGGGGGGAPTNATYITQTPNSTLSAEQALSALATGILKSTTSTGVVSIAVGADLPTHASRHQNGGDDEIATATPTANSIPKSGAGGTIAAGWIPATAVTANTYGTATQVPQIAIGADGRITSATNVSITGTIPGGSAGGDLTGTYPNPTLATTGVSAGTYGSSVLAPVLTIDAKGRVTAVSQASITGVTPGGSAGGDLTGTYPNPTLNTSGVTPGTYGDISVASAPTIQVPVVTIDAKGRITAVSLDSAAFVATSTSHGGDVSGTYNALTVTKINGVSLGGLATGLLKNTNTSGIPTIATASDVIATWTGTCSGSTFLRGDGQCAAPSGAGTVTNTGTLTSGRLIVGNGTTDITVGNLSGVITTAGSTTTTFTNGSVGSGAVVLASAPTVTSAILANPTVDTIYESGRPVLTFTGGGVAGSNNYISMSSAGGGSAPTIATVGADANQDIKVRGIGTGKVDLGAIGAVKITGGTTGQFIQTDGSGGLSFATVSGSGTVTSVATSSPLTGGPITTTGTISCATCVTSATALTSNRLVMGAGSQASAVMSSAGTSGQLLTSAGASEPTWTTATDANTASTVIKRGTNKEFTAFDKGGQVQNVRAYGATGDGSTDDRAAIQSAINSETYGGIIFLPPGDYVLNSTHPTESGCGLVIGNGTTSAYSTQNAITIQGSGGGVGEDFSIGNSTRGATRIKSGTSSITKLICLVGPVVKVWVKDVLLDGNALTASGIEFNHAAEGGIDRVNFRRFTTGWGMDFTVKSKTSGGWAFYSCGNKLTNFSIGEPSNTAFSGIRLSGVYDADSGPYHTSCSNVFERFGVSFGSGSGAIGLQLSYADNNKFINGGFSSYSGGGAGSGKPINFTKQSDGASGANFPYGNKFYSIDSNHSQIYYGTNGDRGNFVVSHTEAEGNADPALTNLFWITDWGRIEGRMDSTTSKFIRGMDSAGTELFSVIRGGDSGNGVEVRSYDEIEFLNGTTSLWMMRSNGVLVPRKNVTAATLPASQPDGSLIWCTDCKTSTVPCSTSGGGTAGVMAIAVASVGGNGWSCNTR